MPQQIFEASAVRCVNRQKAIFKIPHEQSLAFKCAANAFTDDVNQILKRHHGGRRHPPKDQPLAGRHVYAIEEQHMEVDVHVQSAAETLDQCHRASLCCGLGTQLLGVRVAFMSRFAPLLLLLYAVGAADGLTQRAIRRACGGRESASLYHRARYLQLAVLGLGGLALLMWPAAVHWQLCVPLGALVTGGLASVQWAYYKKHM